MVDNFNLIKDLLVFESDDIFYDLQVIRRGKDHPDMPAANRTINSYYICKADSLDILKDEIVKLCELFGARAYINLAPRSIIKVSLLQMAFLSQRIYDGDFKKIWKSWSTCTGKAKSTNPRWVVDIDTKDMDFVSAIAEEINELQPQGAKIVATIPTRSGYHLITTPFRLDTFKANHLDIDVHKNNPTILYIP